MPLQCVSSGCPASIATLIDMKTHKRIMLRRAAVATILAGGILLGGGMAAQAASVPEGCTAVGPVADCTYLATKAGGLVAAGVWRITVTRNSEQVAALQSRGLFDTARIKNFVQPGDRVRVQTFFCICCPFIPSMATVGPAANAETRG